MSIVVMGAVFVDIKGYPLAPFIPAGRNVGRVVQVHGGVCRNVAEDIANIGLDAVLLSVVDESGTGRDVIEHLDRQGVDTRYVQHRADGMGTWLAIFDNNGDVAASISQRPVLDDVLTVLKEKGDEIFANADSVVVEIDMEVPILEEMFRLARKYEIPVYAVVSNMSIALQRREMLEKTGCIVCNLQEAGLLFSEDYSEKTVEEMCAMLPEKAARADFERVIVTMGGEGAVYASRDGSSGYCPAQKVDVIDTTGAGDAFFAGAAAALTYGRSLEEACRIGTRLAGLVIATDENTCPVFHPEEFGFPAGQNRRHQYEGDHE